MYSMITVRGGLSSKELLPTKCCPTSSEGKSVYNWSKRPHLKVGWNEGQDVMNYLNMDIMMHIFRRSLLKGIQSVELCSTVQNLLTFSPLYTLGGEGGPNLDELTESDCMHKLAKCKMSYSFEGWIWSIWAVTCILSRDVLFLVSQPCTGEPKS